MTRKKVVVLSAYHDYRTPKRASIHQVARALSQLGHEVSFISMRYSLLSRWKGDSRLILAERANREEIVDGIRCYLWWTPVHPFAVSSAVLNRVLAWGFDLYARTPNAHVDGALRQADYVVIESSTAAIFVRRIKRLNPAAHVIYYATDRLDTVGAHPQVLRQLQRDADCITHVCVRSPLMAPDFPWAAGRLFRAEFGVDPEEFERTGSNPYSDEVNAVSVGSMLFDAGFFTAVAPAFPKVRFHVIGCGMRFIAPQNVVIYDEMLFRDTLAYVKHATVGLAPYRNAPGTAYLADSSLKLAQFEFFGLPAVCPNFAAGSNAARVGYEVGNEGSMRAAMARALQMTTAVTPRRFKTWAEVAERVLEPRQFADTAI